MNSKNKGFLIATMLATAAIAGITANAQNASAAGGSRTNGIVFDKNNFHNSLNIDNKYFPLKPGTTLTYRGEKGGEKAKDVFVVTDKTKVIAGVTTRVIEDTAYLSGKVAEVTEDWFAQDDDGNLWYMGEFTTELDTGSHEGSWEAGVDGAKPGIIMEAHPMVGDHFFQEFLKGQAEDQAKILDVNAKVCVQYGCFDHVIVTREWTHLDPGHTDHKFYAPGIGEIKERSIQGPLEVIRLVDVQS